MQVPGYILDKCVFYICYLHSLKFLESKSLYLYVVDTMYIFSSKDKRK